MSISPRQTSHFGYFERAEEDSLLQQFSVCPSCRGQSVGSALILPCSHPMCAHCIEAAAAALYPGLNPCTVLCSCCGRSVELPCRTWSSAVSCLPKYPKLSSGYPAEERGDSSQQNEQDISNRHIRKTPADGSTDIQDEEMEQTVHGLYFALDSSRVPPCIRLSNSSRTATYRAQDQPSPAGSERSAVQPMTELRGDVLIGQGQYYWEVDVCNSALYRIGLYFALDSSRVPPCIRLSNSSRTATYRAQDQPSPAGSERSAVQPMTELRGDVLIGQGQYYWEVDVCNSALYRIGVCSLDSSRGWWFERRGFHFSCVYDGAVEPVYSVPPGIKTIGLFLNTNGGVLSFYNALSQEHLVTLPSRFDPGGVVPAFGLGQGRLKMRSGLPPPPLVFHSKDSRYSGTRGSEGAVWRRGVAFRSVRKVVEKFEGLALSR